jgi:hypothetical protein
VTASDEKEQLAVLSLVPIVILVGVAFIMYQLVKLYPAIEPVLKKHPGIGLLVYFGAVFLLVLAFRGAVVLPCLATTRSHNVTDNLGRFYSTEYKDSGEWCIWVRGSFQF